MRGKKINIKDIIIVLLIAIIFGDFFFNDRILLTKFATKFTEITSNIFMKIGEWFTQIILGNM